VAVDVALDILHCATVRGVEWSTVYYSLSSLVGIYGRACDSPVRNSWFVPEISRM
jgi:hypothetical protein